MWPAASIKASKLIHLRLNRQAIAFRTPSSATGQNLLSFYLHSCFKVRSPPVHLISPFICLQSLEKWDTPLWSRFLFISNASGVALGMATLVCLSAVPPLCFRLNISTNIGGIAVMFMIDNHGAQRINPHDSRDFYPSATSRSNFSLIQWSILTSTTWIGIKFCTDIHASQANLVTLVIA